MRIEVPQLPPKEYSPNSRVHWAVRKRAGDIFAQAVHLCALVATPDGFPTIKHAVMRLEFVVAEDRIRDEDNWRCRMKPGIDSLVRNGLLFDDDMKHLTVEGITFTVDKVRAPLTIITVKEG